MVPHLAPRYVANAMESARKLGVILKEGRLKEAIGEWTTDQNDLLRFAEETLTLDLPTTSAVTPRSEPQRRVSLMKIIGSNVRSLARQGLKCLGGYFQLLAPLGGRVATVGAESRRTKRVIGWLWYVG